MSRRHLLAITLPAVCLLLGCSRPEQSEEDTSAIAPWGSRNTTPVTRKTTPAGMTAAGLFQEFRDNYPAATRRYEGKRLTVTGSVAEILQAAEGIDVHLSPGVVCRVPFKREHQTEMLKPRVQVTASGKLTGFQPLVGGVILSDCEISVKTR